MSNLNIPEMVLDLDLSEANPNLNLPLDLPTPTINSVPPLPLVTDPDANSVCVSIEPNHECEIFEMKYDGQEIYKEPQTQSENLAQLISKIDFSSDNEENNKEKSDTDQQTELSENEVITARKFYQNIMERIKLSHEETCVLLDCLTIARADKLLGLENGRDHLYAAAISSFGDDKPMDVSDKTLNVILKKKNIEKSKVLLKKALGKMNSEQESSNIRFHNELYKARQIWRIKKMGTKFICDLSYRKVGCINSLRANVELFKNDNVSLNQDPSKVQYLSVIVPDEFKDYAYIQVQIVKTSKKTKSKESVFSRKFSLFTYNSTHNNQHGWQEILEREQNSIYCKEIYNQLLRETFEKNTATSSGTSQLRPIIIGNSIQIMITMEYDLIISLVHSADKNITNQPCPSDYDFDNAILEYYLHSLLKKSFDQNFFHHDQRPITSTFAYTHLKIAGMAYVNLNFDEEDSVISIPNNISHLLNKNKKINLLNSIKEKAEHLIIRKKILKILSYVSKKVNEPHLFIEQSAWNNASSTDIIVTISSYYYETLAKSFFYIIIKQSQVTILNRSSNISISFTDSIEDIKSYFFDQCCFHQINVIITLSQLFGWSVLGNSFTNEFNKNYMSGTALIYNQKFSKKVAIKVGPVNNIEIYVNQYNIAKDETINQAVQADQNLKSLLGDLNADWIYIKDNYTQVDLDTYPGSTRVQKFELFLAQYSTEELVENIF